MKRLLEPTTTLHTVPVVYLTCSGGPPNVFALSRIGSGNAEPPSPQAQAQAEETREGRAR